MCDAENKLVAWVDGELRAEEAASIERHLEACEECRGRVAQFRGVSENVDRYCDAVMAAKAPRSGVRAPPRSALSATSLTPARSPGATGSEHPRPLDDDQSAKDDADPDQSG